MSASLIATAVSVERGGATVLADVGLTLAPGDRVGVVGPNGVGKSTLLAVLAGELTPDDGRVSAAPPDAVVGWLRQEPESDSSETVVEQIGRRVGVAAANAALEAAAAALASDDADAAEAYDLALHRWTAVGAADFEPRLGTVAADLGVPLRVFDRWAATPVSSLSGGERARVGLAALLVSRFDVVLLDEPTNDLDLDGLDRLERWIVGLDAPVALVSHDRRFLERTVTDVVEIDHHSHRVSRYGGGWASFIDERRRAREQAQERYDTYVDQRHRLAQRAQREREWAARGRGRIRRDDEPDKNIRAFKIDQTEQLAGRAARTERAIERLEVVDEPRDPWELRLSIPTVERSGDIVATARDAVVRRGDFTLGPVDLTVAWQDRVAIVGDNGSGKSTLIDLLLGGLEPTSGSTSSGSRVVVGRIEQERTTLVDERGVLATLTDRTGWTDVEARRLLAKFGLGARDVDRPGSTLSPGERTRAALALLMANGANVLVLDEPTNHLDLEAIEQLEAALDQFDGTVLLVTHDREMLANVRITRTWTLAGGSVSESVPPTG